MKPAEPLISELTMEPESVPESDSSSRKIILNSEKPGEKTVPVDEEPFDNETKDSDWHLEARQGSQTTLTPDNAVNTAPELNNTDSTTQTQESLMVNELARAATDKETSKEELQKAERTQQRADELIANKTYAVPVGKVSRKRNTTIVIIITLVVLTALGLFALNQAGR